ncbi:DNA mismatch repair endonuclease MutL [Cylindrospermopsis raciborskii]|uniref:DNA mismatch repair endonuclease MutL n=1 Tax=Cylindrospermopsis raciborskii TaxID=77022 RepID=UPI0011448A82|nr:DNA mismatch repair endonuclease MutL [Cylindrospermopsis raciborskii]MBU6344001.1 DNA mismatch repair endonuclease MutL [Cyanobacteria bacterium REEB494]TPX27999.1 DNA mismatch repair endonuclease MutL [Cylindrospermopsis raciborskii GIHE 2018]UJS04220.1 DNA mismatch repair endonuclease MutL [Cylindrospermopsis raciborskii KLL07]
MIQSLPTEVVYLITAGEVIDSLSAVVRELVENSLDAGATRIVISLYPEQWRVRVTDNGLGMSLEDLEQAAIAHSTSKIHHAADLWKIKTLGFRGQALHSLTTLGELEIFSRCAGENQGWRVVYNKNGNVTKTEVVAIAPGTVVTVDNLFGNYAERRQGLPNKNQQLKKVQATIQQIALCHPQVTYQVWQDKTEWFTIYPAPAVERIIPQILNQVKPGDLKGINLTIPELDSTINLVVGLPDRCHRHKPDWVKIAINGRIVKSPELEEAVFGAFYKTLPRDRYPVCFVHLTIQPDQINWNRNPAKNEIYLNKMTYWQQKVTESIDQAFSIASSTIKESVQTGRITNLFKLAETKGDYNFSHSNPEENKGSNLIDLKVIGQASNTYIVAEYSEGMWLIEQHIAHERVIYERLCDQWQIVPVESPIVLYQLSTEQVKQLEKINLDIECFGENLWAVRSVPEMLKNREDCGEALLELSMGGNLEAAKVAVACRTAIRNGTPMTLVEMEQLIYDWQRTRNPRTCPHGRPICLTLEESALARFFRRHWVVGKSHGI